MSCRRVSSKRRFPARTGSAGSSATFPSRSGRQACCSSCGRCLARRMRSRRRSTGLGGPRSRAPSPATTRSSSPSEIGRRCSESSAGSPTCREINDRAASVPRTCPAPAFDTPRGPQYATRPNSNSSLRRTRAGLGFFPYRGYEPAVNNKPTYISRDGLEKLRKELEEMVSVRRPEIAQRIHDAKEHGDLSENAEYEDAKNEQAFAEGRIQTLEALIKNATIIDEHHSIEHVQIGSTVVVESGDGTETFTIVGSTEAAPREGRISNESPLGRALLGRKKGDRVPVPPPT